MSALLFMSLFASVSSARRFYPPKLTGSLAFQSLPRLHQSSTLILSLRSHLPIPAQAVARLRLIPGTTSQTDLEQSLYLPAFEQATAAFSVRFDAPGTYPVQVSVYTGDIAKHFVIYVRIGPTGAEVSELPLPGQVAQTLDTQARFIKNATNNALEIRGQVLYFDDNIQALQPIRDIRVELWEANAVKDVVVDDTTTNADGAYTFSGIENQDPEDGTHRDVYIVAVFENDTLRLTDASDRLYTLASDTLQDVPDGQIDLTAELGPSHARRGTGHIFNVIGDAHEFLLQKVGWSRTSITVIWPTDEVGSFYNYYSQGPKFSDEIHIASTDAWERITMLHEYGHAVMSPAYQNDFDQIPSGDFDQPHYVDTVSDPGFALSEGWAEFMEAAVDDSALQLRGYINRDAPNVEDNAWHTGAVDGTGSNTDGNIVEGAVASILWDITDTAQSLDLSPGVDDDSVSDLFSYAWQIFTQDFPQDIRTLGVQWKEHDFPEYAAVETIFALHGIPLRTNRTPVLTQVSPVEDTLATGTAVITWQATDLDNDPLTVDLFFDQDTKAGGLVNITRGVDASAGQYTWSTASISQGAYYVLVRVSDTWGASAESYSAGRVIVDPTPLPPPPVLSGTHPDPDLWVANASPHFTIESAATQFSYVINQTQDTLPDKSPDTAEHTIVFANLSDGVWWFHVRGYDSLGYWTDATHYQIRIQTTPPPIPENVAWYVNGAPAPAVTDSVELELRWDAVSDPSGIAHYEISVHVPHESGTEIEELTEALRYSFVGITGKPYEAEVRAVNGAGLMSGWSSLVSIQISNPRPWDVNSDGVVDVLDLTLVALHFGTAVSGAAPENPDVTGDGFVDILDLVTVGQHFGESYGVAAPRVTIQNRGIFALPNYPNPFNPETWIPFVLLENSELRVTIYDVQGNVLRQWSLGNRTAGVYLTQSDAIYWDGRTEAGEEAASGTYFCQIQTARTSVLRKLVVLR